MKPLAEATGRLALAGIAAAALSLASCRDQALLAPAGTGQGSREFGTGEVRLSLAQSPGPQPGQVTYTLSLLPGEARLGSYQGSLRFPAGELEVLDVRSPASQDGEYHVVNAAGAAAGSISFGAYSLHGFASDQVLTLRARVRQPGGAVAFDASLSAAGGVDGAALLSPHPLRPAGQQTDFPVAAFSLASTFIELAADTTPTYRVDPGAHVAIPTVAGLDSAGTLALDSIRSRIRWNTARLTFDSLRAVTIAGWSFTSNVSSAGSGEISFTRGGTSTLAASTSLAVAYFTASATAGGTLVTVSPLVATNPQLQSIVSSIRPRPLGLCVAPVSGKWGDGTDDGAVNIIDAQQIARYSAGLSVANQTAVQTRGDVTADGAVNIIDAQQVARYSAGLSATPRTGADMYVVPATTLVTMEVPQSTIAVDQWSQLLARTYDQTATEQTGCSGMTWNSSDPAVATVNAYGLVVGVAPGTADISATSGGVSQGVTITVQ